MIRQRGSRAYGEPSAPTIILVIGNVKSGGSYGFVQDDFIAISELVATHFFDLRRGHGLPPFKHTLSNTAEVGLRVNG